MVNYSQLIGWARVLMLKPSVVDSSSDRVPAKAPRWDLVDTGGYGGGIRVLALYLIVWGT